MTQPDDWRPTVRSVARYGELCSVNPYNAYDEDDNANNTRNVKGKEVPVLKLVTDKRTTTVDGVTAYRVYRSLEPRVNHAGTNPYRFELLKPSLVESKASAWRMETIERINPTIWDIVLSVREEQTRLTLMAQQQQSVRTPTEFNDDYVQVVPCVWNERDHLPACILGKIQIGSCQYFIVVMVGDLVMYTTLIWDDNMYANEWIEFLAIDVSTDTADAESKDESGLSSAHITGETTTLVRNFTFLDGIRSYDMKNKDDEKQLRELPRLSSSELLTLMNTLMKRLILSKEAKERTLSTATKKTIKTKPAKSKTSIDVKTSSTAAAPKLSSGRPSSAPVVVSKVRKVTIPTSPKPPVMGDEYDDDEIPPTH